MEDTDHQRLSGMFELDPGPSPPPPQPVGVYGWRKRCLYASVLILMISVILNLALTIWIMRVLSFSLDGIGKLNVHPDGFSLRGEAEFLKTVYVDRVQSEKDQPLYLYSNKQVNLISSDKNSTEHSQLVIDEHNIEATCDVFHVKDLNNNTQMLLNGSKVTLGYSDMDVSGAVGIKDSIRVPAVLGHEGTPLAIQANTSKVLISGFDGVSVEGRFGDVDIEAKCGININASKGPLRLDSKEVVLTGLPQPSTSRPVLLGQSDVYQLCVCQNGALFLDHPDSDCEDSSGACLKPKP